MPLLTDVRMPGRTTQATDLVVESDFSELSRAHDGLSSRARIGYFLLAIALVVPLFELARGTAIMAVVVLAGIVAIIEGHKMPAAGSSCRESVADLAVVLAISALEPNAWAFGVVGLQGGLSIHALRMRPRRYLPVAAGNIIAAVLVGAAVGQQWQLAAIVMPPVTFTAYEYGRAIRRSLAYTRHDLEAALSATGAISHLADTDRNGISQVLGDVETVTGWTSGEWLTMDHQRIVHPDDLANFWVDTDLAEVGQQFDRTGRIRRPDGTYTWIRDISRMEISHEGQPMLRGLSFDVTDLEEANQRLRYQARHDQLTGLFNRIVLGEAMDELLLASAPFALLMLDMNRFKEINDTLGHHFGDEILCEQAKRLTAAVRPEDIVIRLGGDEFAVIAKGVANEERADELASRLSRSLAEPLTIRGVTVAAPASTGVVIARDDQVSAGTLLRQADIAMYEAKRIRSAVRFFTAELERASVGDATLGAELVSALDDEHIRLHFQPKVDLETGAVVGAEGLARWEHPEQGLLSPNSFLHLLDVSEAHRRFTDQMIEQGVVCAKACSSLGHDLQIAVNVSIRSLQDQGFAARVRETLDRHGVAPRYLILEVTEQDLHDNNDSVLAAIQELADAGVEFAIDDFGTGFSSLERLRDLPVHELKVDRTFVQRALSNSKDHVIASTIIGLADQLGHRVVAEGVEEREQADMLLDMGCTMAQGFLFSQATTMETFLGLITQTDSANDQGDHTKVASSS